MPDAPDPPPRWTPERWRAAEAILDTLIDLPMGARRRCLQELSLDPEIRSLVETWLDSLETDDDFLSGSVEADAPELWARLGPEIEGPDDGTNAERHRETATENESVPRRIGPWRILRPIGRGGMGTVHLAERADGAFEQTAAVKLLRRGLDTDDIVARFLAERQILADLDHPNVARLLDGGATEDGRPYLVMEYVDGEPIDAWCDSRDASLEERLELFTKVCDAVAYAHRNLVVHRDLKPSNILVKDDGEPKIVDFGIAKLLEPGGESATTMTRSPMWTPTYAAPEQILGEAVTTATDVWGLGAVLYRLLAGESMRQIDTPTPVALERAATEAPTRPSENTNPDRTGLPAGSISGDLDAIVTTAARAEPDERYATAAELGADLRRYLEGQPVEAREPTLWYRTRKFVARRKLGVAAAAAILLLAVAYVVTLQVQSARISAQAARIEEERDLARSQADKWREGTGFWMRLFFPRPAAPMRTRTAEEMLDTGIDRAEDAFDLPEVRSKTLIHLAYPAYWMGRLKTSEKLYARAVEINEAAWYEDYDPRLGWLAHHKLGVARHQLADYARAEANYRRAFKRYAPHVERWRIPEAVNDLGWLYHETGDLDRAERLYRRALKLNREIDRSGVYSLENLAMLYADRGQLEAAENLARKAVAARSRWPTSFHTGYTLRTLGRILHRRGETVVAERLLRSVVALRGSLLDSRHFKFAEDLSALAVVLMEKGELREARRLLEQSLEIDREALGEDHPVTAVTKHQLATIHHRAGHRAEAERLYEEAVDSLSGRFGRHHTWTEAALEDWARLDEGRPPAEREWLSGTRLPVPTKSPLLEPEIALDGLLGER